LAHQTNKAKNIFIISTFILDNPEKPHLCFILMMGEFWSTTNWCKDYRW